MQGWKILPCGKLSTETREVLNPFTQSWESDIQNTSKKNWVTGLKAKNWLNFHRQKTKRRRSTLVRRRLLKYSIQLHTWSHSPAFINQPNQTPQALFWRVYYCQYQTTLNNDVPLKTLQNIVSKGPSHRALWGPPETLCTSSRPCAGFNRRQKIILADHQSRSAHLCCILITIFEKSQFVVFGR